jgi:ABC-type transporter Mla subunit MlaD
MTTERWTDEMLDRLVGSINTLADVAEQNTRDISELKSSANSLLSVAQIHQQNFEIVIGEIQEIQAEVRGLQTENRRILDQLINRNGDNG